MTRWKTVCATAMAVSALSAGAANAAVTLYFEALGAIWPGVSGAFTLTLPYAPYAGAIPVGSLTSCTASYTPDPNATCGDPQLAADSTTVASGPDFADVVAFSIVGANTFIYYFPNGAFDQAGVYGSTTVAQNVGRLTVTGVADPRPVQHAVPEPATWALLIVGFGAAGSLLRRSRPSGCPA